MALDSMFSRAKVQSLLQTMSNLDLKKLSDFGDMSIKASIRKTTALDGR